MAWVAEVLLEMYGLPMLQNAREKGCNWFKGEVVEDTADNTSDDNNNYDKMKDLNANVLGDNDNNNNNNGHNGNTMLATTTTMAVVERIVMKTTMGFSPCSRKQQRQQQRWGQGLNYVIIILI